MEHSPSGCHREGAGFSLVEILAVLAVIGVLLTVGAMAFNQVGEGTRLSTTGNMVESEIALAVQHAHSMNRRVEVRFYPDADPPMMAVVEPAAGGQPAAYPFRPKAMPQNIVFEEGVNFSTLLDSSRAGISSGVEPNEAPFALRGRAFRGFSVSADGRTSLRVADEPWMITFRSKNARPEKEKPAPNFVTLLIDPISGAVRSFQP